MTIHEAAEDAVRAWESLDLAAVRTMTDDPRSLDLVVRMRLLADKVDRVHALGPGRILEYPSPRDGEQELSGPMTEIPMAEIVVRSDGGPWAVHNQPCAVCGERTAILDLNQGVMLPCGVCAARGWQLSRPKQRIWWRR